MRKIHLILSVMLLSAASAGCASVNPSVPIGLSVTGPGAALMNQSQETEAVQETAAYVPISADDIRSGYFKLDGVTYKLPTVCQEFINNGWQLDPAHSEKQLAPGDSLRTELRKGSGTLSILIGNPGDEKKAVTDLPVTDMSLMYVYSTSDNSQIKVELPKDVPVSPEGLSNIIAAHGEPDSVGASGPGNPYAKDVLTYLDPNEGGGMISFRVNDNGSGSIYYFTISNEYEFTKKQNALRAAGAAIAESTKEVAAYQAPTALGEDITSGIIEFAGDLYRLPVPVSALQKNGWKLSVDFPSEIEPGEAQMVYLSRGEEEIHQYIVNLGTETAVHSNCFADRWNTNQEKIKTGTINIGDTREKLLELIKDMDYEHDPDSYYDEDKYDVKMGYSDDSIRIDVSDTTNKVIYISVKKEEPHK